MKLNILLAKTDALATVFKNMIADFSKFFNKAQGAFAGEKKTYTANDGTVDEPTKRGNVLVQTTVDEKLQYFLAQSADYINSLFSQERTNASGIATADLIVNGNNWGNYTSLELLRLKSLLDTSGIKAMLTDIPVRSDSEEWETTDEEMYSGRRIFEGPRLSGTNITTVKENYILKDPNVDSSSPSYTPTVATKTTLMELGQYSVQKFSGAWSQRERAHALKRASDLSVAVTTALKECNQCEVVPSFLTAEKIFGFIFYNEA